MKERPILFSAPMVRAILAGTKTQTRRIITSPYKHWDHFLVVEAHPQNGGTRTLLAADADGSMRDDNGPGEISCPYGQPGDRLWVRETWGQGTPCKCSTCSTVQVSYRATYDGALPVDRWRPSIHMPRWASRLSIEVTGIRVERLQDITYKDCYAEGLLHPGRGYWHCPGTEFEDDEGYKIFRKLWESINGPGTWDANPWVWVVEFKRAGAPGRGGEA